MLIGELYVRALGTIDADLHPVFAAALRHLQQPDRQAVRALINEFHRLSIAVDLPPSAPLFTEDRA